MSSPNPVQTAYCCMETKPEGEGQDFIITAELDPEKTVPASENVKPAPDGGARAWVVAAGGSCLFFCCLGFSNAFGTFEEYYLAHQLRGESLDNIAWIGSLSAFLQFASGLVGGPLFDLFGGKVYHPVLSGV